MVDARILPPCRWSAQRLFHDVPRLTPYLFSAVRRVRAFGDVPPPLKQPATPSAVPPRSASSRLHASQASDGRVRRGQPNVQSRVTLSRALSRRASS